MFDDDGGNAAGVVQGDFATNGLMMFVMLIMLIIPFINDPKQKAADNIDPPHQGVLKVEIFWPDAQNLDVDLWVGGPVGKPVGYSNKGGELWNLLRDDLGTTADTSGKNMEVAYTRGIWDGEYIVNVHLYNLHKGSSGVYKDGDGEWKPSERGTLPVPVRVHLFFKPSRGQSDQELVFSDVELKLGGQELTVFRFRVEDGKPVMESLNNLQKRIRPANRGGYSLGDMF
jgi:hypothetical protein